jgi:putative ABC transport system permease protein
VNMDPTNLENGTGGVDWDGKSANNIVMFTNVAVGYEFVKTMKLKLAAGREFSPGYVTDTTGYMLNEEALRRIGYKDPIGRRLTMWGKKGTIVGIVKDFHFTSLHNQIQPLIIRFGEDSNTIKYGSIIVRVQGSQMRQTLAGLERLCHSMNPKFPFSYTFADDEYRELYKSESIVHSLSNCFAGLAIIICCLGLLGLTMFTAEQRTKEFGIRKVLGARPGTLFTLLSNEFLLLVVCAFLVASPLACWAMFEWLKNFAYHTPLHWWVVLLAGMVALLIALLTVSFQAVKVAMANPIKSLRTE